MTILLSFLVLFAGDAPPSECVTPEYYQIDLVPTSRVPVARSATGTAYLNFVESPFGIAVSAEGYYQYQLEVVVENLRPMPEGEYIAWLSTPDLKSYVRLGPLVEGRIAGTTEWNKFLVFLTLEAVDEEDTSRWHGPVVMRGLSRSGLMHTMAGHGPFESEPCAVYGYY